MLLGSAGVALINTACSLSLVKGALLVFGLGFPLTAAMSFFTVPSVGYGTQTLAFARNSVLLVLVCAVSVLVCLKRVKSAAIDLRRLFAVVQVAGLLCVWLLSGGQLSNVQNYGDKQLRTWALPVDRSGVAFLAVLDDSIFVVGQQHLYRIDVPSKRVVARIELPSLNADQVGYPEFVRRDATDKQIPNPVEFAVRNLAVSLGEVTDQHISFGIKAVVSDAARARTFDLRLDFDLAAAQLLSYQVFPDSSSDIPDIPGFAPPQNDAVRGTKDGRITYFWGAYEIWGTTVSGPGVSAHFDASVPFSNSVHFLYPVPVSGRLVLLGEFGKMYIVEFPE
jgi:hypothetical protein